MERVWTRQIGKEADREMEKWKERNEEIVESFYFFNAIDDEAIRDLMLHRNVIQYRMSSKFIFFFTETAKNRQTYQSMPPSLVS